MYWSCIISILLGLTSKAFKAWKTLLMSCIWLRWPLRCSRQFPLQTIDGNVTGLRNLLDYFKEQISGWVFIFSSSEVYGNPTDDAINA